MDHNLNKVLSLVFGDEGGYVNRKTDRGGPTKYGITAATLGAHRNLGRPATAAEVKALTKEEAAQIYKKSYWVQSGAHLLPDGLDYMAFDFGVNSGPARAVKRLQKVVGADQDGTVGGKTLQKIREYSGGIEKLLKAYADERMAYLRSLGGPTGFGPNGRGWTIRVTGTDPKGIYAPSLGVIGHALAMAKGMDVNMPVTPITEGVGGAKGYSSDTSVIEALKDPETRAWGGTLLSAVTTIAAGSGPMQWALAAVTVGAAVLAGMYILRRLRSNG